MAIQQSDGTIVTGGAGFLGSFVIERLERSGYSNLFVPRLLAVILSLPLALLVFITVAPARCCGVCGGRMVVCVSTVKRC